METRTEKRERQRRRERKRTRRINLKELSHTHKAPVGESTIRVHVEFRDVDHATVVMGALKRFVDDMKRARLGTEYPITASRYIALCEETANDIGAGLEAIVEHERRNEVSDAKE